jgi:hypothetical protein
MKICLATMVLFILFACISKDKEDLGSIKKKIMNDETRLRIKRRDYAYQKEIKAMENEFIADSLCGLRMLEFALNEAYKQRIKINFYFKSDSLEINYGFLLSSSIKHLIIKRVFNSRVKVDLFKLQKNEFKNVVSKDFSVFNYINDTIQDINGDNYKDYLIHWYPMSGCCSRDVFDVFLQNSSGEFKNDYSFINPTFFSKEKVIRGRCYGHSPPFYKFKWKGVLIDTIEYIFQPDSTNGNRYIKRKQENLKEKGIVLQSLPVEYKNLNY